MRNIKFPDEVNRTISHECVLEYFNFHSKYRKDSDFRILYIREHYWIQLFYNKKQLIPIYKFEYLGKTNRNNMIIYILKIKEFLLDTKNLNILYDYFIFVFLCVCMFWSIYFWEKILQI